MRECLRLNSPVHGVSIVDGNESVGVAATAAAKAAKATGQSNGGEKGRTGGGDTAATAGGGVSVTLKEADGEPGETLWADAVIVAVPISLLQEGALKFDPPLPAVSLFLFFACCVYSK